MQFRIIRGGCMLVSALAIAAPAQGAGSGHFEALSQRLLEHVKYHEPCQDELAALKSADRKLLFRELSTDGARKAFWINLYNALAQLQIDRDPSLYQDRRAFFNLQNLTVAGRSLSLDDIEHRLLRRAEPGFLPRFMRPLFMSRFISRASVEKLDPRIHFALNCNARSCPPILYYEAGRIDELLDKAALAYLTSAVSRDGQTGTLELPELFQWFAADFGGRTGIIALLRRYNIIDPEDEPVFTYKSWDWTPEPGRFQ